MGNKNFIQVFEHQKLRIGTGEGALSQAQFAALARFNEKQDGKFYSIGNKTIKFRQYVGCLQVGRLTIEVLPKVSKDGDSEKGKWKEALLNMLKISRKLKINSQGVASQKIMANRPLFDIYIGMFLDQVQDLYYRGLVKKYRRHKGQAQALKGKLLINQHLRNNMFSEQRFYVNYNKYDYNNPYNSVLYTTLLHLSKVFLKPDLKRKLDKLLFRFPELKPIHVREELFERLHYDRKTEPYRDAIELARMILHYYNPNMSKGSYNVLAIFFDMNRLWEESLYRLLRKNGYTVSKESKTFWGSANNLCPDFVIGEGENLIIADAKWKAWNKTPSISDLRQVFAYAKFWKSKKAVLLYPGEEQTCECNTGVFEEDTGRDNKIQCSSIRLAVLRITGVEKNTNNGQDIVNNGLRCIARVNAYTPRLITLPGPGGGPP